MLVMPWTGGGAIPDQSGGGSGAPELSDDFSTDTSGNYSVVVGSGLSLSGGYATMGADLWNGGVILNNTPLSSSSHYIDFTVEILVDSNASVVVRSNGTTGYMLKIYYDQSEWDLEKWDGVTASWEGTFSSTDSYVPGFHRFKLTADDTTFSLFHWNGSGWDQMGSSVVSTAYTSGSRIGLMFSNNGSRSRFESYEAGAL